MRRTSARDSTSRSTVRPCSKPSHPGGSTPCRRGCSTAPRLPAVRSPLDWPGRLIRLPGFFYHSAPSQTSSTLNISPKFQANRGPRLKYWAVRRARRRSKPMYSRAPTWVRGFAVFTARVAQLLIASYNVRGPNMASSTRICPCDMIRETSFGNSVTRRAPRRWRVGAHNEGYPR